MMAKWFPNITTKEDIPLAFDYTNDIGSSATISSAVITQTDPAGTTTNPSETITSQTVSWDTGLLTTTGVYLFECVATLSTGRKYEMNAHLRVVDE